jgi:hypothetical protein
MATPARMVELECPGCHRAHWVIDNDYRGSGLLGKRELAYEERTYACPACSAASVGHRVLRKAPAAFFLQPHPVYPLTTQDFAHWLALFRAHFPSHERLRRLGVSEAPRTPRRLDGLSAA